MSQLIKKGDLVQVISGDEGGRRTRSSGEEAGKPLGTRGRVKRVVAKEGLLEVEGVRVARKAVRPNPRKGIRGGFMEKTLPVRISNVMLVCPGCDRPVRPRRERREGKKVRVCRRCGGEM